MNSKDGPCKHDYARDACRNCLREDRDNYKLMFWYLAQQFHDSDDYCNSGPMSKCTQSHCIEVSKVLDLAKGVPNVQYSTIRLSDFVL